VSLPVTFCCCIDKGVVHCTFGLSRSFIVLDRMEPLSVWVDVDNSQGQNPVQGLRIELVSTFAANAMGRKGLGSKIKARSIAPATIAPGARGRIEGQLAVPPNASPTFNSVTLSLSYLVTLTLEVPWASDISFSIPVDLFQTVDPNAPLEVTGPRIMGVAEREFRYNQPPEASVYPLISIPFPPSNDIPEWDAWPRPFPSDAWVQEHPQFDISPPSNPHVASNFEENCSQSESVWGSAVQPSLSSECPPVSWVAQEPFCTQ
jgi:hypothetical protein